MTLPDPWKAHGFMLYVIVGGVTFPIWGPLLMAYMALFLVGMILYGFIFAPIRWAVIGIKSGDWDPDNFERPSPSQDRA